MRVVHCCLYGLLFTAVVGSGVLASKLLAQAPSVELADAYVEQGLNDKAMRVYEQLLGRRFLRSTHQSYLSLLMRLGMYARAERHIKKYRKLRPNDLALVSDWVFVLHAQDNPLRKNKELAKELRRLGGRPHLLPGLANFLFQHKLHEDALQAYDMARRAQKQPNLYSSTIAQLHLLLGNRKEALEEYLVYLRGSPTMVQYVLGMLRSHYRLLQDQDLLQEDLFSLQKKYPNNRHLFELSIGMALYREAYKEAFAYAKLLHKRQPVSWSLFGTIAKQAFDATRYEVAWEVYDYMVVHYINHAEVVAAQFRILEIKEALLEADLFYDVEAAEDLAHAYLAFADQHLSRQIRATHRAALLYGRYLARPDTAIVMMQALLARNPSSGLRDQVKIDIGDMYLLSGRPWEAMLWYIRAEKDQKQGPLYERAKLSIAKISLYQGEVRLARAQLNILASTTSQRVANDALDLLRMIQLYDEDSLVLQQILRAQKYEAVFAYDSVVWTIRDLLKRFPDHAGHFYTQYSLAEVLAKQGLFEQAVDRLLVLREEALFFADKILWLEARIMERISDSSDSARSLYVQLIKAYPQSILIPRARARLDLLEEAL